MTMNKWIKLEKDKDKKIYDLLLPYYDLNYKKICDKIYSYSHRKKYLDDCIRLYTYLTLTCGQNKYEMKGTDLVKVDKEIIFNPMKDGSDLLHIIVRMVNDEKTHDHICKLLDKFCTFLGKNTKEYIYNNAMIKEMNTIIKNDYGIDIIKLYTKKKKILIDYHKKIKARDWIYV